MLEKCEEEESELTMQDPENEEIIGHKSICAAKASTMGHERKKKKVSRRVVWGTVGHLSRSETTGDGLDWTDGNGRRLHGTSCCLETPGCD